MIGDKPWSQKIDLGKASDSPAIAKLWANRRIADIEAQRWSGQIEEEAANDAIAQLGLAFSVVTSQTSLVAVDETPTRPNGAKLTREELPLLLPKGWDFDTLLGKDAPVVWRGPMVGRAVVQLARDCDWGELDYLIIDMPPGTGDAQLSLGQGVPLAGGVIVTTPQDIALLDAGRGLSMFRELKVPVLGIVENMSYFACPHCGEKTNIFSHGGGRDTAERLKVPFLGEIPLDVDVRIGGDTGAPITAAQPDSVLATCFMELASRVAAATSIAAMDLQAQESGFIPLNTLVGPRA
jgi:hypothetical protein